MTGLTPELAVLGIALGLVFSLVCYLATNLSPGGMISPGWLAIVLLEDVARAVAMTMIIIITYVVARGAQRLIILYGKRLFASVVLIAVFLQLTALVVTGGSIPFTRTGTEAVGTLGFIVPGLVAYQLLRQPIFPTAVATVSVTVVTYGLVIVAVLLRAVPEAGLDLPQSPGVAGAESLIALALVASVLALASLFRGRSHHGYTESAQSSIDF